MFKLFQLVFISLKYLVYLVGMAQLQQVHDYGYGSMYQEEGIIGPNGIEDPEYDWDSVNC